MKRINLFIVSIISGLLPVLVPVSAYAQSASTDDPVRSGLQTAYNTVFGSSTSSNSGATKPATTANRPYYAALGDSVAAGLGLSPLANPSASDTACGRSAQAYSRYVANSTKLPLVSAACSDATAGDLFTRQSVSGPNIPAQLETIKAYGKPGLITITAGANDAHWSDLIKACYAYSCTDSKYTTAANAYLVALQAKLYIGLETINQLYPSNPPKVLITGYYNPLSERCSQLQTAINPAELNWVASETTALNQTIQNVNSQYPNVTFVPVDFSGHDICSTTPWVQGVSASAPFHPTATGQRQIAKQVITKL